MTGLKQEIIDYMLKAGATAARVTVKEKLFGPPSADPTYVLPSARSIIAFNVALDRDFIPDYFGKVSRLPFRYEMYRAYQSIGSIGRLAADYLTSHGFQAVGLSPNGVYRRELSRPGFLVPDFSVRFAALASGLATQGWSGNVLYPGHWAATFYGAVITDAELQPDDPSTEAACDQCKMCTRVCPPQFFAAKESQSVTLGGKEFTYGAKRSHMRCGISCAGFAGLSRNKKWSSWSTGPETTPENDENLPEFNQKVMKDPLNAHLLSHIYPTILEKDKGNGVLRRRLADTNPTCCNCLLVCSGPRPWRQKLVKLLHSSGIVIWENNQEVVKNHHPEKSSALLYQIKQEMAEMLGSVPG
jgi:epoxyqueuosine reductase